MRFGQVDGFLVASLVTGPKHILLQLKLAREQPAKTPCEHLPAVGDCLHRELDARLIMEAVLNGVAKASARSGSTFFPSYIRYVCNDTGPEDVYGVLAAALVEKVASGQLELP